MTKKILSLICVILSLSVLLCACGNAQKESSMENVGSKLDEDDEEELEITDDDNAAQGAESEDTTTDDTDDDTTEATATSEPDPTEEPDPVVTEPDPSDDDKNVTGNTGNTTTPQPQPEPEPEPDPKPNNVYQNDSNFAYTVGQVTINPKQIYWEGDALVAVCFVTNGLDKPVFNLNLEWLEFSNQQEGTFASGIFGNLNDLTVPAYGYITHTFRFKGEAIDLYGADLTGTIRTQSRISYSY